MIEREARAGRPVAVLIFDIDHFKSINDRFGHPAGDEVLKLFSAVMNANLRITDLIGRIGGEEFAAMLPCSMEETLVAADRVREAFQNCGIEVDDAPVATTVSIGVAGGPANTELDVLLASADTALYRAKRGGRNRVRRRGPRGVFQRRRCRLARDKRVKTRCWSRSDSIGSGRPERAKSNLAFTMSGLASAHVDELRSAPAIRSDLARCDGCVRPYWLRVPVFILG